MIIISLFSVKIYMLDQGNVINCLEVDKETLT